MEITRSDWDFSEVAWFTDDGYTDDIVVLREDADKMQSSFFSTSSLPAGVKCCLELNRHAFLFVPASTLICLSSYSYTIVLCVHRSNCFRIGFVCLSITGRCKKCAISE
ncbi:unnamed protein product [Heterobilharzia americana]|nr:unnamed protein product [Heterobilharzia americana]